MKTKTSMLVFLVSFFTIFSASAQVGNWEKLGQQKVNFKSERDVIKCSSSKTYSALKIKVEEAPVEFESVQVRYANGSTQDIELRNVIRAGGESRVINLTGNKRAIKEIVFRYKTQKVSKGKAQVEVWGRR